MADDTKPDPQVTEAIPATVGSLSAIGSIGAPMIYCEAAPCFGVFDGVVHIALEAQRYTPSPTQVLTDRVTVAHLRMPIGGARSLINALQKALLLLEKPDGPAN